MTQAVFAARVDRLLNRVARRLGDGLPQVAVRAPKLGIDYHFGDSRLSFHTASITKIITATLVMQQIEAGRISLTTPVSAVLPADELRGLFIGSRDDIAGGATVEHLLSHTAGLEEYFDGPVTSGVRVVELVKTEPDRLWTPAELLAVTRERQLPVGRVGQRFHYCDTGYLLAGRILEEITGCGFPELVHREILVPLRLDASWLPQRTRPASGVCALAPLYLGGEEVSRQRSLSAEWAGGGLASSPDDLLSFNQALYGGRLIGGASLAAMARRRNWINPAAAYGAGLMSVRATALRGHVGFAATQLWRDTNYGADIVINLGSERRMAASFAILTGIEWCLRSCR